MYQPESDMANQENPNHVLVWNIDVGYNAPEDLLAKLEKNFKGELVKVYTKKNEMWCVRDKQGSCKQA